MVRRGPDAELEAAETVPLALPPIPEDHHLTGIS